MWFSTWLNNRTTNRAGRRMLHRAEPPRFRPQLEAMEDRTLPSTFYAATVSDLIADINAANKAHGANTIVLTAPTTSPYVLTAVDNTTDGANGLPVIGKKDNLTIVGNVDTIERSTAAGTPAFRLFDVAGGGSLTLENVTLQNGLAFGSGAAADGGAIYNQGTLTLSGATVQNNAAHGSNGAAGGYTDNIKKIAITNGHAGADAAGGGIWSSGAVTLESGTSVQGNVASGGQGGVPGEVVRPLSDGGIAVGNGGAGGGAFGGGLYEAGGSVNATNATVANNKAGGGTGGNDVSHPFAVSGGTAGMGGAGSGGGLFVANGTLSLSQVTVQANQAVGGVGGNSADLSVSGSGGDGSGGGIYLESGQATLTTINLLLNYAVGGDGGGSATGAGGNPAQGGSNAYGGGLYVGGGTVTLTNDTVTNNQAEGGFIGGGGPFGGPPLYGSGYGYGIFIASGATVYLDLFTLASVGSNNIDGTYILT